VTKRRTTFYYFALALALLTACASPPEPKPEPLPETEPAVPVEPISPPPPPPPPPEPDKSDLRITIASVGDMMIGTDYPQNHLPDDDGLTFLAHVTPTLAAADITFGNLEGVLVDGGEPGKKCSNPNACYLFRSPTRYALHYRDAGFDVLSLANNHARDFGEEGRTSSMEAIAAAGMHHSGRVDDFASFEQNGLRVAVLAYAVTRNSNMLLDYELAFTTVAEFAATHDIVVVSFHGGAEGADTTHIPFAEEEYYGEPRGDVVWFARGVVDAGADLVIGHGPHVVRGMERYKERLIAYSLGNFATYYGISVAGIKGIAPVLTTTLDGEGKFIEGDIVSTVQLRPDGPSIDPQQRALNLIRGLSAEDFGESGLTFQADGRVLPAERPEVPQHELTPSRQN
jgi:poly-gamma-glutamate capsule biosynthesis protein CapA/YwtB (metallophosphatase superfamily)